MINLNDITNENNIEHNEKWSYIPGHPYRILIIGGKTNALLNLIKQKMILTKFICVQKI